MYHLSQLRITWNKIQLYAEQISVLVPLKKSSQISWRFVWYHSLFQGSVILTDIKRSSNTIKPIQGLQISVNGNKLNPRYSSFYHPHDGISASTSYSYNFYDAWGNSATRIIGWRHLDSVHLSWCCSWSWNNRAWSLFEVISRADDHAYHCSFIYPFKCYQICSCWKLGWDIRQHQRSFTAAP